MRRQLHRRVPIVNSRDRFARKLRTFLAPRGGRSARRRPSFTLRPCGGRGGGTDPRGADESATAEGGRRCVSSASMPKWIAPVSRAHPFRVRWQRVPKRYGAVTFSPGFMRTVLSSWLLQDGEDSRGRSGEGPLGTGSQDVTPRVSKHEQYPPRAWIEGLTGSRAMHRVLARNAHLDVIDH